MIMKGVYIGADSVCGGLSKEFEGPKGDSIGGIEGWLEDQIKDLEVGKEADK